MDLLALTLVLRWLTGWALLWRVPRLAPARGRVRALGRVSVVVPARDEELLLPRLLAALGRQTRPPDEIIVVDDHSGDATAAVAAAGGARVVTAEPLPPGWTGKTWACWQGAHAADGDVLVLLDADTDPRPELLERLVGEQSDRGGLVSVQPYHRMVRPYERLSAFFNAITWMGVGAASIQRGARVTGAFGPCLACERADYLALAGHKAVRSAVLEDVALGRHFLDAGQPTAAFGGKGAVEYRMYPHGLGHLVEGWSKNFAAGAGTTPPLRLLLIVAWLSAVFATGFDVAAGLVSLAFGGGAPTVSHLVWYALFALQIGLLLRRLGNFRPVALLYPLPALAFLVVFFRSLFHTLRGEVEWKGRTIPVRNGRR